MADGGVAVAASVACKRFEAHGGIATGTSTGIGLERRVTNGRVFGSGSVVKERVTSDSYAIGPLSVGEKRADSIGSILPAFVFVKRASRPVAVFPAPVVLLASAVAPVAVFELPSVLLESATTPVAVLPPPIGLLKSASTPLAVLLSPLVLLKSANAPLAVLAAPVVLLKSAPAPVAVF